MNVVPLSTDLTLPSGPASYEDVCTIHRQVTSILSDDLNKIEEGTYDGDEKAKAEIIKVAIKFLKDNKILVDEDSSPRKYATQLESLELPTFRD